jgi:hypothetical protein
MLDLSIIIISWNTRQLLANCLTSILQHRGTLALEIIVVDNASHDGSATLVADAFPDVRLKINASNVGFAPANNQAIREAQGRYILLLNSDTVVHPEALALLVRYMDANPRAGIAGACLLNADGSLQPSWAQFPSVASELLGENFRVRQPLPSAAGLTAYAVDWVGGACLLIRRAAIEQVGLMDESFFMYSEETDWCFRVKRAGWLNVYLPQARVTHFGGASSRQNNIPMFVELNRSKLLFFRKHYGRLGAESLRRVLLASTTLKLLAFWLVSRLGGGCRPDLERHRALLRALQASG